MKMAKKTNKIFKNENGSFRVEEVELETKETQPILFIVYDRVVRLEDWKEMEEEMKSNSKGEHGNWENSGKELYKLCLHPIYEAACKGKETLETLLNDSEYNYRYKIGLKVAFENCKFGNNFNI